MLGNITLVMPLEKLYNSTFQKQWDRTMDRIRVTSPRDLEAMDKLVRKLEKLYEFSGVRKLSTSMGTYPDEYSRRINTLRSGLCEGIQRKFEDMVRSIKKTMGDYERLDDYDSDRKEFDEAMLQFSLLRAFYRRWRLDTDLYRGTGSSYDYKTNLKRLAYMLARKRTVLMREYRLQSMSIDYKQKTDALAGISEEIDKTHRWYEQKFLNTDWNNVEWSGADISPWMKVDFADADDCFAPLERLRKVPTAKELEDLQKLFGRFADFYTSHSLVGIEEISAIYNYSYLQEYASTIQMDSQDSGERLKAGLLQQMLRLHRIMDDANRRVLLTQQKEKEYKSSFAMYFAPIDEVYEILRRGYICSEHSLQSRIRKHRHNSLIFHINADIKDGDVGFIFPLTKVIDRHMFYELSDHIRSDDETNNELHVMNKNSKHQVRIDIRNGVFVAPKNKVVLYGVEGQTVRETSEQYFTKFFKALAMQESDWFDPSRLHNWLSRHCVFYDDKSRAGLLNMLRDRTFVHIMNHFTNKNFDNLSLAPTDGQLFVSDYYVQHKFENIPDEKLPGVREVNLSLFEWHPKVD